MRAHVRIVLNMSLLNGEVHRGRYPVEPVEAAFDLRGAGGTTHSAQP